jgi:membrane-associated phospholipid phosphatase
MNFWSDLNLTVFHLINGFAGRSVTLDRFMSQLETPDLRGLALVIGFGALWFGSETDQLRRRKILVVTLISIAVTIFVIRGISFSLPFEARPMITPNVGFRAPLFTHVSIFEDWSSFPSDTAGMMFAVATGFWFASRKWGYLLAILSVVVMGARVYVGIHFPGDIFVAALIAISVSAALNIAPVREVLSRPFLSIEQRNPAIFYACLLAVLYEAGTMFVATRMWGKAIYHLLSGHYT